VALGVYLKLSGALPLDWVRDTLKQVVSAHYQHLIAKNAEALQAGYDAV
jgi:2-oxoglutarate ferredoxin oxidoreductase subunit gamma